MMQGVKRVVSDDDLRAAVRESGSWRGVLRALGYASTSGGLSASLQVRAKDLDIDTSHFLGQRTWSDVELGQAISESRTWTEVTRRLGLSNGSRNITAVKTHAARLQFDRTHLGRSQVPVGGMPFTATPDLHHLRSAAPAIAASWFLHRGYSVSYPAEPCAYDLVADDAAGGLHRIQVKTATCGRPGGPWRCALVRKTAFVRREPYDPDSVDFFFLVDGDLRAYLVPIAELAGQCEVSLPMAHRQV